MDVLVGAVMVSVSFAEALPSQAVKVPVPGRTCMTSASAKHSRRSRAVTAVAVRDYGATSDQNTSTSKSPVDGSGSP